MLESSTTGMQSISVTGVAMGLWYKEHKDSKLDITSSESLVVVYSLGDASVTEGEIAEAFQMAVLKLATLAQKF